MPIIRRGINSDIRGLSKGREARETKEGKSGQSESASGVRADAYCDHKIYNSKKHGLCHHPLRKLPLGNAANCGRLELLPLALVKSKSASSEALLRVSPYLILGATVILVLWARIRLSALPLERDEGEYAYMGQLLLHGIPPYKLAYSMKFPGTAAAYALLMSVFGQSAIGIHIGLILINLTTIGLVFLLGRALLGELGGVTAAASYSVLSLMPYVLGQAAHATHFVVLFAIAGAFLLIRALDRPAYTGLRCGEQSLFLIFTSGVFFGLALLMKQPGLFFLIFGSIYLFSRDWRARLSRTTISIRNVVFLGGAAVPCLLTGLSLWSAGVFEKFWFWTIKYAGQYGSQVSFPEGLQIFAGHFWSSVGTAWPIWALAAVGLLTCVFSPAIRGPGFLTAFAFFSALAVCPGFYFRPHYFILFLPAVSLLAGATVVAVREALQTGASNIRVILLLIFTLCLGWPLWSERDFFFERSVAEANRMVNGTNPFPESIKIADYIRAETTPSDTIAVLGSEPQIYFYAQRRSATGYIYTYSLMEPQPYARQMQQEMIREIETARPKFLVLVVVGKSWLAGRDSDQTILRWADNYCDANYEEVGLVNISDEGTDYYFSSRPPNVKPTADHILIYRWKS